MFDLPNLELLVPEGTEYVLLRGRFWTYNNLERAFQKFVRYPWVVQVKLAALPATRKI
jgi:hypothetical protein